jgi:ABC-type polysaccharide/polyol phosphate transport system ATPase subunit
MVARLGFAIATAIEPDILLLDEGLGSGDARFAARAEARMQALIQRTRILVLASHSDALIKSMCNRAILLEKGRLIEIGPIDEVISRYHERPIEAHVA